MSWPDKINPQKSTDKAHRGNDKAENENGIVSW